jgi:hypothetical protein
MRRTIRVILLTLFGLIPFALASLPTSWLPVSWKRFVLVRGTFDGKPVQVAIPSGLRFPAPTDVQITMEKGVCDVSFYTTKGRQELFSMGQGYCTFTLSGDGHLLLNPKGAFGTYRCFIGSKWQPFAPLWRFIFFTFSAVMFAAALAAILLKRPLVSISLIKQLGFKRVLFLVIVVATVDFLHSPIHEFGHYAVGVLLGGKVDRVAWTVLSGEVPHVSFRSIPAEADPWMKAAGTLFPFFAGIALLTTWLIVASRTSWYFSAALLVSGVALLFFTLNAIPQVLQFEKLPYEHMGALAWHLGLRGWSMVLFVLSPLAPTVVMYGLVGYRLHTIITNASR